MLYPSPAMPGLVGAYPTPVNLAAAQSPPSQKAAAAGGLSIAVVIGIIACAVVVMAVCGLLLYRHKARLRACAAAVVVMRDNEAAEKVGRTMCVGADVLACMCVQA